MLNCNFLLLCKDGGTGTDEGTDKTEFYLPEKWEVSQTLVAPTVKLQRGQQGLLPLEVQWGTDEVAHGLHKYLILSLNLWPCPFCHW